MTTLLHPGRCVCADCEDRRANPPPLAELTIVQRAVVDAFVALTRERTVAPTIRELSERCRYRHHNVMTEVLRQLTVKGWIDPAKGRARTMSLTAAARRQLGIRTDREALDAIDAITRVIVDNETKTLAQVQSIIRSARGEP